MTHGRLALTLQEVMTATVRLRAQRQVAADAYASFREHIRHLLGIAEREALDSGYAGDDVRLALFAVVAFLDESVLNSANPMFAEWPRRPLQDELFGGNVGGEAFFQQVRQLLVRQDSEQLADLLEIYQLCMLLGFHGRYSATESSDMQSLIPLEWAPRSGVPGVSSDETVRWSCHPRGVHPKMSFPPVPPIPG